MNGKCFEMGVIQAFLDGETAPGLSYEITDHAASCDDCALLMSVAEEESAFVFSALDREFNSLVPTQRLWNRINESIAVEKSSVSFWEKLYRSLSVFIANPSITVAASILIVFGLFAVLWNMEPVSNIVSNDSIATSAAQPHTAAPAVTETVDIAATGGDDVLQPFSVEKRSIKATNLPPAEVKRLVTNANYKRESVQPKAQYAVVRSAAAPAAEYLPGEDSYIRAITNLKQNIDGQKDVVLNPSSRVAYERDMAVVNDAITKMKEVVRKNPRNQSAKQVLYSSYQNKIDLLNSVVDREELMARFR